MSNRRKKNEKKLRAKKIAGELDGPGFVCTSTQAPGVVNPMLAQVHGVMEARADVRSIANEIRQVAEKYRTASSMANMFDYNALLRDPVIAGELKEKMRALYQQTVLDQQPIQQNMPKPPPRTVLYARAEINLEVWDIGAGPEELDPYRAHLVVHKVDHQYHYATVEEAPIIGQTTISYNSATQLSYDEFEKLKETDGIHICPDIAELDKIGVAVRREDGLYETRYGEKVFVDRLVEHPCMKIEHGYMAFNTYRERRVDIQFDPGPQQWDYTFAPDATPDYLEVYDDDLGYKFDGVAYELHLLGTHARLMNRNGSGFDGVASGDSEGLKHILVLEMLPKQPPFKAAVLCRVLYLKGLRPFHSGDLLRYFLHRNRIRLKFGDGQEFPVVGPPPISPEGPVINGEKWPTDGLIARRRGKDYYIKTRWTVDLVDPARVIDHLRDNGWKVIDGRPGRRDEDFDLVRHNKDLAMETAVVKEYEVEVVSDGVVAILYNGPRSDKPRSQADTPADVMWKVLNLFR